MYKLNHRTVYWHYVNVLPGEVRFLSVPFGVERAVRHRMGFYLCRRILPIAVGALLLFLLWKPCLPFLAAFFLSCAVQKPYRILLSRMCRRPNPPARWKQMTAAIFLILCCVIGGGGVLLACSSLLISEIGRLVSWIGSNGEVISAWVGHLMNGMTRIIDGLPIPDDLWSEELRASVTESVLQALPDMLGGMIGTVSSRLSSTVTAIAAAFPKILLFLAVFLIAAVYMTVSHAEILSYLQQHLPSRWRASFGHVKRLLGGTVRSVLRAWGLLSVLAFVLLFVGLLVLGVGLKRAFAMAGLGTVLDILPIFGVGTLLIPWAIFAFFGGRAGMGVGLVVLYLVISFARQALQPRLLGKTAGVHPLAVLFALYAGGVVFGFWGMIAAPFLLTVIWGGYRMLEGMEHA